MINFNGSLSHMPHQHWQLEYQYTFDREIVFDLLKHQQEFKIQMIAAEGKHLWHIRTNQSQLAFFPTFLNP